MKRTLTIISLFAITISGFAFDGHRAMALIDTLCCAEFEGRKSGEETAAFAENWVAGQFAEYGLRPGGTEGFLQSLPILCNREVKAGMELLNGYHGKKKYVYGEDFHLITNSGSAKIKAEVMFVGYSIEEPELGHDDYEGVDLQGKIALIYKEVPGDDRVWANMKWREYKAQKAVEHGAAAVIFVGREYPLSGAAIKNKAFYPKVPMMMIAEFVAVDIFRGTGKNFKHVCDALKSGSQSFNTGKILKIATKMKYEPEATAANVIGILPGSDELLKEEWVIVGGHLDHNGINAVGDVFYGADDNASGTAVVMELARCFAEMKPAPKRSMMFIAFAGEEQGLLGSKYYVDNPIVPLVQTAAMFNFDCCGTGEGKVGFGGKEHYPEIWDAYKKVQPEEDADLTNLSTCWGYGSDQAYFERWGVCSFNFWSSGRRPFYHHVEDLPDQMSFDAVNNTGRIAEDIIKFWCDWENPMVKEHQRARTLLYSAQSLSIDAINRGDFAIDAELVEQVMKLRNNGLKGSLVKVRIENAYREFDEWGVFCEENGFSYIDDGSKLNSAIRAEKFALMPVLSDIGELGEGYESKIRNLYKMGVRSVYITKNDTSFVDLSEVLKLANELGYVFVCDDSDFDEGILPEDCRKLLSGKGYDINECDDECKIVVRPENGANRIDPGNIRHLHLNPDWGNVKSISMTLELIEDLENSGVARDDIKYLLGDNLLELLTW